VTRPAVEAAGDRVEVLPAAPAFGGLSGTVTRFREAVCDVKLDAGPEVPVETRRLRREEET
jgi:preprotein translocase subunit YajC